VLAADCVYDDELTSALVHQLELLLPALPSASAIVAVERRVNFSLEAMRPCAPATEHFLNRIAGSAVLQLESLEVDAVEQRFEYVRARDLRLWRVTAVPQLMTM
jgi:hypothetical protein